MKEQKGLCDYRRQEKKERRVTKKNTRWELSKKAYVTEVRERKTGMEVEEGENWAPRL